jgi:hypothetical protein
MDVSEDVSKVNDAKPDFVIPYAKVGGVSMNETPTNSYLSETVSLKSAPLNTSLLDRLERQKYKYWHFKFVNPNDLNEFKKRIIGSDLTLTVDDNDGGQQHADITIRRNQDIVGKLHFLHANRPDICDPKKFYVKVHYYHFTDKEYMDKVKEAVRAFFDDMESRSQPASIGGKQAHKRRTLRTLRTLRNKRHTMRNKHCKLRHTHRKLRHTHRNKN